MSFNARDFELSMGFPNYWHWGFEDNMLQKRTMQLNAVMSIDRSQFYPVHDTDHITRVDSQDFVKTVNIVEFERYMNNVSEGFSDISDLDYDVIDEHSIRVNQFSTSYPEFNEHNSTYNILTNPSKKPFMVDQLSGRIVKTNNARGRRRQGAIQMQFS